MGALRSFVAGTVLTLLLVVLVPMVIDRYVSGLIEQVVGDAEFLLLTSETIVTILIWVVMLAILLVIGAGGILKRYGLFGILGLIFAYWVLGDVTDAVLPLLVLAATMLVTWVHRTNKKKKDTNS